MRKILTSVCPISFPFRSRMEIRIFPDCHRECPQAACTAGKDVATIRTDEDFSISSESAESLAGSTASKEPAKNEEIKRSE